MADFTLPPDPKDVGSFMGWARQLRRVLQEALDDFNGRLVIERTWAVPIENRLLLGAPTAMPTLPTIAAGALTGEFEWAYSYSSTEGRYQTTLSPATAGTVLAAQKVEVEGQRSTDPRVTTVRVFRRDTGEGDADWLQVGTVANPTSGTWTLEDNTPKEDLSVQSTILETMLWAVCGTGYRLVKVKIAWDADYDADPAAYWEFWLAMRRDGYSGYEMLCKPQTTEKVSLLRDYLYWLPFFTPDSRNPLPGRDLDMVVPEDARVYLMARGIGGVAPLPNGIAQVIVSRQEG